MNNKVLVVDDEKLIVKGIKFSLEQDDMEVDCAYDGEEAVAMAKEKEYDIILLDLMLPKLTGLEVCQYIREFSDVPIIMITAKGDDMDKILGLEYGADDYITKPFASSELVARIKAVLRRSGWETSKNVLTITPDFHIDFNKFEVYIKEKRLDLTLTEFKILQLLTQRPGWVYSRSQILDYLWGNDKIVIERTVDVHIRNLREKLGDYAWMIKNIRGMGYKFSPYEEEIDK